MSAYSTRTHGKGDASIIVQKSGVISYQCFHSSCKGTWKDAKKAISGYKKIAEFCEGYDPNWQPPTQVGSGIPGGSTGADSRR